MVTRHPLPWVRMRATGKGRKEKAKRKLGRKPATKRASKVSAGSAGRPKPKSSGTAKSKRKKKEVTERSIVPRKSAKVAGASRKADSGTVSGRAPRPKAGGGTRRMPEKPVASSPRAGYGRAGGIPLARGGGGVVGKGVAKEASGEVVGLATPAVGLAAESQPPASSTAAVAGASTESGGTPGLPVPIASFTI